MLNRLHKTHSTQEEEKNIGSPTRENFVDSGQLGDSFNLGDRDGCSLREPLKAEDLPSANMEAIEFLTESEKDKIKSFFRSEANLNSLNKILRSARIVK